MHNSIYFDGRHYDALWSGLNRQRELEWRDLQDCLRQEIEALLHYNGFALHARFGDYNETPFTHQSSRQLIVCIPL